MVGFLLWLWSETFENRTIRNLDILVRISNGFDKITAICPDFKWLGFQISDLIRNPDHLQPNLFLCIQNPD